MVHSVRRAAGRERQKREQKFQYMDSHKNNII